MRETNISHFTSIMYAQAGFTSFIDLPVQQLTSCIFQLRGILLVLTSVVLLANGYPTRPSEKQPEEVFCVLLCSYLRASAGPQPHRFFFAVHEQ